MPSLPRRYSSATPLLVLSLLIGLISLPDVTNRLLKVIDQTVSAATNSPQLARAVNAKQLAQRDPGIAAPATTFTVTNTNDSGAGSLRQAILDANANAGMDLITFSIGTGLKTISPASSLPTISDPVVIDGTTQPGFAGSPLIEIDALHSNALPNSGVLSITGGGTTIRGLIINGFYNSPHGIVILTAGGNHIEGCYIGTDPTGNLEKNSTGVGISINDSPNNIIGGTTPGSRNVISGIRSFAIGIGGFSGTGNQIQGNYIGTNAAGTAGLGNFAGIALGSSNNIVGGTVPGARNVISGNDLNGVIISSGHLGMWSRVTTLAQTLAGPRRFQTSTLESQYLHQTTPSAARLPEQAMSSQVMGGESS